MGKIAAGGPDDARRVSSGQVETMAVRSAEGQALAAELRRAKQAAGLSFTALAARTPYSRASLERYVNGKLFPTRQAVHAVAAACADDPGRLCGLWDGAYQAGRQVAGQPNTVPVEADRNDMATAPAAPSPYSRLTHPRRRRMIVIVAAVGAVVIAVVTAGAGFLGGHTAGNPSATTVTQCRSYDIELHSYTVGRLCWTTTAVTASGYLWNVNNPTGAAVQMCLSEQANSCGRILDVISADPGQEKNYQETASRSGADGAWVRICVATQYCSPWK